ncbi:MAG: hypothetical protein M2R45_00085 [Verrucomicrobia subdivision 3 bacterium]|nr:hypothetical protein [Limisphaerales bacterium]MCS1412457.1 hypothetical protein [Limisphaerales bacterium]
MPLSCKIKGEGQKLLAFDLTTDQWEQLRVDNRRKKHLRMPCCDAKVVLKKSNRGTRFFAHKRVGDCDASGETEHHLRLKQIAVEAARSAGWEAETEVPGGTPSSGEWVADVLATKGHAKVAIEIQWSGQTYEKTLQRQQRYKADGVRCLWLMRRIGEDFTPTRELPIAQVSEDQDAGYLAHLTPGYEHDSEQVLPVREFLDAAFSRRFHFSVPRRCLGTASVRVGNLECWRCKKETNIISFITVDLGFGPIRFTVPYLDGCDSLVSGLVRLIPRDLRVGAIKHRHSKTQGYAYLSNGCGHCGALIGQFFEYQVRGDDKEVARLDIRIDDDWLDLLCGQVHGWTVYTFENTGL